MDDASRFGFQISVFCFAMNVDSSQRKVVDMSCGEDIHINFVIKNKEKTPGKKVGNHLNSIEYLSKILIHIDITLII